MARVKKMAAWEDIVLRLIAVYKILHGVFFIAVGVGLIQLKGKNIPQVLTDYVFQPMGFSPENKMVDWALDEHNRGLITPEVEAAAKKAKDEIAAGTLKVHDYMSDDKCPF